MNETNKKPSIIVSINQPDYLPWPGFFFKLYFSDIFVFLDDVQFSKPSFTRHVFIRNNHQLSEAQNAKLYLSVPIRKHHHQELIKNLYIAHREKWIEKHIQKIYPHYKHCPYFEAYFPFVSETLSECKQFEKFSEMTIFVVKRFLKLLAFSPQLKVSSDLPVLGHKSEYVINIVKYLKGNVYLSGTGAKAYQTNEEFQTAGIKLVYQDFYTYLEQHPYFQIRPPFVNGLSIIDALFNIGVEGIRKLLSDYAAKLSTSEVY
jgi:hypothetical protein